MTTARHTAQSSPRPRPTAALGAEILGFSGVGVTYPNGTRALDGVDLKIRAGEFVSVVGPSGCGKSTLLSLASGLATHTDGYMQTGTDRIGYVFQDATLLPWRTVEQNVEMLAELDGIGRTERRDRAAAAIELVGLAGFEKSLPRELSGGMKMRVSLARSLTLDPELFLFDEPFGALDEITRQRLGDELLGLFAAKRFAGLFITHSVAEAVYLSTRVVVMSGRPGRITHSVDVPFGPDRDPEIRYTADYINLVGEVSQALEEAH